MTVSEIEEALGFGEVELLEEYAEDSRGLSALFLGFSGDGLPLHAVIGLSHPDLAVVITFIDRIPTSGIIGAGGAARHEGVHFLQGQYREPPN